MAFIIVIDYFVAIEIDKQTSDRKKKLWLILSLVANIGILIFFKYFNFLADNINQCLSAFHTGKKIPMLEILLPIGLSFHTLQAMSYTIEVSRGKFKVEKHFGIYALYVMFYPQMVAGPIERPQNIIPQFHQKKYFNYENARSGLILIAWGIIKKMVIADRLGAFVNQVHAMPDGYYSGIPLIISLIACTYQIYCDFSGYSDIARGCAKVMGYDLMVNFKTPLVQKNISQFWATYHISLTSWFRDYVYLPIRKNYFPNAGMWLSVLLVLVLSGVWHGADWHYIMWGVANAVILILYTSFKRNKLFLAITSKMSDWFANKIMLFSISAACVFFRASSVTKALHMLRDMFKNIPQQVRLIIKNQHSERLEYLYIKQSGFDFIIAILLVWVFTKFEEKFKSKDVDLWVVKQNKKIRWTFYYGLLTIFILLGIFKKSEFIYFQF